MSKNRKHVRISYEKNVELIAEGRSLTGKSINISNSGIQVVVNVPVSRIAAQRIAFSLPVESDIIHIPCKIVRSDKDQSGEEEEHVLGIEFSYQTEAQMLLIENFIREMKIIQLSNDLQSSEMRIIPRISCNLNGVTSNKPGLAIFSIDNISSDGCLISFEGSLAASEALEIEFSMSGNGRRITLQCAVAYVIKNYFGNVNRAGLIFNNMPEIDSNKIRNFIVQSASISAIRTIQDRRNENIIAGEYQISEQERIAPLLTQLKKEKDALNFLFEDSIYMFELLLRQVSADKQVFKTTLPEDTGDLKLKKFHRAYFSFYLNGSSYYFTAELLDFDQERLTFGFPLVMFQSEKRSDKRKFLGDDIDISLKLDDSSLGLIQGKLVNISRRGFLCNVVLPPKEKKLLESGKTLTYYFEKDLGLDTFGEIRHLKEEISEDGAAMLEIGVEAGIRRSDFRFKRFSQSWWNRKKSQKKQPAAAGHAIASDIVGYMSPEGREIVALLNYTRLHAESPVVIMPPAFGKKKEALSPLVATLIENFGQSGKDIVTVRYDGINRPGESYNEDMCPKRGYEMLHYRISQGQSDLKATLDFVCNNRLFRPSAIIVVAFSMSSLDARKLAVKDDRIDYLVNVMGVTCARSSFRNTTGGIDIIGNARIGIKNGLSGVLGHILNLDAVAQDLIDNKYAYLADVRHDMSRIGIPVSWIYGRYDKWISEREISDIMSVRADGAREVIEIPTGHNLRSSEDAIKTFKIITGLIYRRLHGKNIRLREPDRDAMVNLITNERERLTRTDRVDVREYWKDYLIGGDRSSVGYDFYKNVDEFREFLSLQGSLMDIKNGEIMADMGCGTGIFIERMLEDATNRGRDLSGARLVLLDLVEEALLRTREKYERLRRLRGPLLPRQVDFIQMDLEPNRLLPVKRFIEDESLDYNFLRNRVEGLKNSTIDRLIQLNTGSLSGVMRGGPVTDEVRLYMNMHFSAGERGVVYDFNRAVRYLTGALTRGDLSAASLNGGKPVEDYKGMKTSDIYFSHLNFGAKGLELHLSLRDSSFDKISASLLVSYLFNPDEILLEFYRLIKPGGLLLVSSMRPDSDISVIFSNYISKLSRLDSEDKDIESMDMNLAAARAMLNEAASLFELEEDGYFKFYSGDELADMLKRAGFKNIGVRLSLGNPPQAVIATGIKPSTSL